MSRAKSLRCSAFRYKYLYKIPEVTSKAGKDLITRSRYFNEHINGKSSGDLQASGGEHDVALEAGQVVSSSWLQEDGTE